MGKRRCDIVNCRRIGTEAIQSIVALSPFGIPSTDIVLWVCWRHRPKRSVLSRWRANQNKTPAPAGG